jgi:predicted helicase
VQYGGSANHDSINDDNKNRIYEGVDGIFVNRALCVMGEATDKPFSAFVSELPPDLHLIGAGASVQIFTLYRYDAEGQRQNNLTDWGVKQFEKHYGKRAGCTRERIFAYVYAVLHHPAYREKYALNLKRELPRIPLYGDAARFKQWADWGEQLLALHTDFEQAAAFPLQRSDAPSPPAPLPQAGEGSQPAPKCKLKADLGAVAHVAQVVRSQPAPKCKLKADKLAGRIEVDAATTLGGIPAAAWDYKLGNRSALEWVLDQYKESTPRDPTIAAHFNTYRFADYKARVVDLLMRVTTVSVETMRIIEQMPAD